MREYSTPAPSPPPNLLITRRVVLWRSGLIFAGLGLYLQVWADICRSGLVFAGLGLYLQVWANICRSGLIFCRSGLIFAGLGLY